MSVRVMSWVFWHATVKGAAWQVLVLLADAASDDGLNAYPSRQKIALKANLSEKAVREAWATLAAGGWIEPAGWSPAGTRSWRVVMRSDVPEKLTRAGAAARAAGTLDRGRSVPRDRRCPRNRTARTRVPTVCDGGTDRSPNRPRRILKPKTVLVPRPLVVTASGRGRGRPTTTSSASSSPTTSSACSSAGLTAFRPMNGARSQRGSRSWRPSPDMSSSRSRRGDRRDRHAVDRAVPEPSAEHRRPVRPAARRLSEAGGGIRLGACPCCQQRTLRMYAGVGGSFVFCTAGCRRDLVIAALGREGRS